MLDSDVLTRPADVQQMFDNIPIADKKLYWIEGTPTDGTATLSSREIRTECWSGSTLT